MRDDIVKILWGIDLDRPIGVFAFGRQRQRVSLGRATDREPKVLMLDEGTANLDEPDEELIADASQV